MKRYLQNCLLLVLALNASTCFALDRNACMQSISLNPQYLDRATNLEEKISNQALALLSSGNDSDFNAASEISNAVNILRINSSSIEVIISLRQNGTFKNPVNVDRLVDLHLSGFYKYLQLTIKRIGKAQGFLKNSAIRSDTTELIIELSRISERLKFCERV